LSYGTDTPRLRVLLVEDDEDDYVIIRDLLAEIEEFDLEWVSDYGGALEAIAREEHDVCLLDYRLGERSGLELLREASRRGFGTPMILLTGQGGRGVDLQAMQAGAADYLVKGRIDAPLLERAIRYAFARTLKALGESERRFRSLIQNASDIVTILEVDGTVRYESPSIERVLGYSSEELVGKNAFEYVHGDDLEPTLRTLTKVLEIPGATGRVEFRFRHKDGSWRWLESVGSDRRHDPAVRGVVINSRDITERKHAEEALKESERRFRQLFENSSDALFVHDEEGRLVDCNAEACRALGYTREELLGLSVKDVTTRLISEEERRERRGKTLWELAMWGEPGRIVGFDENELRRKDGSTFPVEVGVGAIEYGGRRMIFAAARDVTERKQAEDALRAGEAKYRTLVEQIPAVTYIGAVEREEGGAKLLYASPQIETMFGYSPDEWMAHPELFPELLHPEDRERVVAEDARTDETGEPFRTEYRQFTKDGRVVWVRDEAVLVRDEDDEPLFWQGVMFDVTDQKRAEERLRSTLGSLLALHEAGKVLSSTLQQEEIGSRLLEIMQRISGLDAAIIDLNDEGGRLSLWRTTGSEALLRSARSTPEAQAARRKALGSGDRQLFELARPDKTDGARLVGLYLPLRMRDQIIGVLEAYGPKALAEEGTVETIASLAGQAVSALENASLYAELAERERRLRDLVGQVLAAQEEERRRVAYEVHDGLAQTAAAAHQLLQAYARHHAPDSAKSREKLDRVLRLVQQTVGEARDVIADLRPTVLDDFGLATAIRQQVERLGGDDRQIDYEETLGGERLPAAIETALYRVAQEALANVRKHASSARTRVTLQRLDGSVCLRVQDWGRGFRVEEVTNGGGPGERVGLSSMRERVVLLGGSFGLISRPGTGTEVVAEVPLPAEHARA
jgi:PAS domain S-box-containing protein